MWYDTVAPSLLWTITWTMTMAALGLLGLLLIVHFAREHLTHKRARRHNELQRMLLIHLETPLSRPEITLAHQPGDLELLAQLSTKILRVVGGQGKQHIQSFVERLGLEATIDNPLHFGTKSERLAAIELLGALPFSVKHQAMLTELLKTEADEQIRCAIAASLSAIGHLDTLPKLLHGLEGMGQLSPLLIYDILRRYGPDAYNALAAALGRKNTPKNIQMGLIRALADVPTPPCRDTLIPYCYSEDPELCTSAFQALAQTRLPLDPIVIAHGANHTHWKVRLYATQCARHTHHIPIATLKQLMMDANWMVSVGAAQALYEHGNTGRCVLEMLAAQHSAASGRAAMFLAEKMDEACD